MQRPINNIIRQLIVDRKRTEEPSTTRPKTNKLNYEYTTKFIQDISNHYNTIVNNTPSPHNINQQQHIAIKQLKRDPNIIIKPVDKNLGVALIHTQTYLDLAYKQHLNDNTTYKRLNHNPYNNTINIINTKLQQLNNNNQINKAELKRLLPKPTSTAGVFYILPKLHKAKLESRPIVSNVNHPTKPISQFVHDQLHHTASTAPSYIDNSNTLVQQLKLIRTTTTTYIITADIKSLYTNIPNQDGIKTVCDAVHNDTTNRTKLRNKPTLAALLDLVLNNNIFTFDNTHYQQINGTAMGTIMAPTYANIYLRHKEEQLLNPQTINTNIQLFKRYIDDIITIYDNHDNSLPNFINNLRTAYQPLQLSINIKRYNIEFLDLKLSIDDTTSTIKHTMYVKPTNHKTYLPPNSLHPQHTLDNIIYNDLLRSNRLCNSQTETLAHQTRILANAVRQGYSFRLFKQLRSKATYRMNVTQPTDPTNEPTHQCYLTLTHQGPATDQLIEYIKKRWHETADKATKLIISRRTNRNYQQLLVKSRAPTQ